jgi:hypothetical protein
MICVRSERLTRWLAGPLMVVLAHGLVASTAARAGCSHPVTSEFDRRISAFDRLDDLITGGPQAILAGEPGRLPPAWPRPCDGPGCKQSAPRPASTATPIADGLHQWLALGQSPGRDDGRPPSRLVPERSPARPAGHAPSVFHPPPI